MIKWHSIATNVKSNYRDKKKKKEREKECKKEKGNKIRKQEIKA